MTLKTNEPVFVAGHRGMVGKAVVKALASNGHDNILQPPRAEVDLTNQAQTFAYMADCKPSAVVVAAAKVGGIHANDTYSADFIYENLMIECNLIRGAYEAGVKRLVFLGSSCIYPRMAQQPMNEDQLLTAELEPTNEAYALAKIAGIKLCESFNRQYDTDYRSLMPTNLYGENDNFHPQNSHVIPGLLNKFHDAVTSDAAQVEVWGSGRARREFLHVDDLARAVHFFLMLEKTQLDAAVLPMRSHINIGTGVDLTIAELAKEIAAVVGFKGELVFNTDMPDGTPVKRLDVTLADKLGWRATTSLSDGLRSTYRWYLDNLDQLRSGT